jgi:hypothetical protein
MLTEEERQRVQEVETLRAEIRTLLETPKEPAQRLSWFSTFIGHEAGRLVLGFLLTTAVGSWLTYWWKAKELTNQAETAALKARVDAQTQLLHDLTEAASASLTACNDVLALYFYAQRPPEEVTAVRVSYFGESAKWRTASKVIRVRLAVHFKNSEIHNTFAQLVDKRRRLGVTMMRLLSGNVTATAELENAKTGGLALANESEDLLIRCGGLMAAEIEGRTQNASTERKIAPNGPADSLP